MSNSVTTVGSPHFPVQDITHKPKRMQGANFTESLDEVIKPPTEMEGDVEAIGTIEGAIRFYETTAKVYEGTSPNMSNLFVHTAKWLRELLVTRNPKSESKAKALEEVTVDVNSNG